MQLDTRQSRIDDARLRCLSSLQHVNFALELFVQAVAHAKSADDPSLTEAHEILNARVSDGSAAYRDFISYAECAGEA